MPARRDFTVLRKEIHHGHSSIGALKFLSAAAVIGLGAGVFFMLPDDSSTESPVASAAANAPQTTAAPDESFCDKQAWPYVDQRCAKRIEAARGTREVRIVTDKGHSVKTVTPLPVVEPKPAAPTPVVAQADKPIGPAAAPVAAEPSQTVAAAPEPAPTPQTAAPKAATTPAPGVQVTVAPANRPAATEAMAREVSSPSGNTVAPSAASNAPAAPGVDAFADAPPKKSKSARAAEKAEKRALTKTEKREAKRAKPIDEDNSGVPEDVVTAKSAPARGQNSRPGRNGVPDDVVAAVEEAAAEARGRRGRGVVTIRSPGGDQRIYLVPSEGALPAN
jgi:hypothetical protein